jgi:hypothetical protein
VRVISPEAARRPTKITGETGLAVTWEALASVFFNIAIRALGKKEAITELRRMTDWLERTDTRKPPN